MVKLNWENSNVELNVEVETWEPEATGRPRFSILDSYLEPGKNMELRRTMCGIGFILRNWNRDRPKEDCEGSITTCIKTVKKLQTLQMN